MKKVIRLTESDLTRIVKRVISEQNNTMKLKILDTSGSKERSSNIDLSNIRVSSNYVYFDFKVAGDGTAYHKVSDKETWSYKSGLGAYKCDTQKNEVVLNIHNFSKTTIKNGEYKNYYEKGYGTILSYFSKEGAQKIQSKYCSKYASTNTTPSDDATYA